ncbi:MAG: hypothetical protein QOE96_2649 [Blastocatellia bacterium]|jgi:hypothetical protein|nr:hypothetical protein [Blastocatellia bacterium]
MNYPSPLSGGRGPRAVFAKEFVEGAEGCYLGTSAAGGVPVLLLWASAAAFSRLR